jgi:hypothetical protein
MEKKWYQSKKFISALATIAAILISEYSGLDLSVEQLTLLVGSFLTYILVEFGLDRTRAKGSYHPLQDPAVRDAMEALISDMYDFGSARADGIDNHISQVKEKVITGLTGIGIPQSVIKDGEELSREITRIIIKMYREDQKMTEGADLVRRSGK